MTIYNIPEQDARVTPRVTLLRVSQDGLIVAPLVGTVQVKGKTPRQLEQDLRQRYEKYIKSPQIGVLVTEYRQRVSVMGAVQKPGVFELTGPKTVIDMVALAGGITEKAGNQVHLYRQDAEGRRQTAVIDLLVLANPAASQVDPKDAQLVNVPVQAGDVINVPQAGMYFVDGAVHKPGSYPIGRNYTVTQALAAAGGLDPELADSDSITIYRRRSPTDMETIPVNIDEVLARKRPDLQVQPDDVIVVPMSSAKYFVKRFVGSLISGVSVGQAIR
jgi:polysaccharide export outer membrane protein